MNFFGELNKIITESNCTRHQFQDFFKHPCWREIKETLNLRLAITRDNLEATEDSVELYRQQGMARELRFLLSFEKIIENEFDKKGEKQ